MAPSRPVQGTRREQWERKGIRIEIRDLPEDITRKREYAVPFSHVTDRDRYDVIASVKKIRAAMLLIAGGLDTVVPSDSVRAIYDSAHEPKRLVVLPSVAHDYRVHEGEIALVNATVMGFLESMKL